MTQTTLYLLPTPLSEDNIVAQTPPYNISIINSCDYFIVEELKTARRYLRTLDKNFDIDGRTFVELNEHTSPQDILEIFKPLQNKNAVLMSEAGCPGVADPGAAIVQMAHKNNIRVVPLIGPSSILMAVMSSGLNGQNFAFNGYLPKEKTAAIQKIRSLEKLGSQQSQWFIETPYRNMQLLDELLNNLSGDTKLCVAANINSATEFIRTKTVGDWKKGKPEINKIPCVFGIGR
ncbi:MAG: SAM-dependent methyltransferase [Bacteroidia bacterium]